MMMLPWDNVHVVIIFISDNHRLLKGGWKSSYLVS